MVRIVFFFVAIVICFLCCTPKLQVTHLRHYDEVMAEARHDAKEPRDRKYCTDPYDYAPYPEEDEWLEKRIIRINFHIMNDSIGDKNFPETEETYAYFKCLVDNCNERLRNNRKMNLPVGNQTPNLDPKYRYRLVPNTSDPDDNGIYFHYDNEHYFYVNKGKHRNNYKREVIEKYGVNTDSILNVFVLPHHPDSVKSKTYGGHDAGIALGTSVKIAGLYDDRLKCWEYAVLLNHEIGHVFGLNHAWTKSDGCDDTPPNPNCWGPNSAAPCNTEVVSNNLMDYNAQQMAITPCQLGRVHRTIADLNSKKRGLVIAKWCEPDLSDNINVKGNIEWRGAKDLNKNIIVHPNSELTISCRLSLANGRKIIVKEGGVLILNECRIHNACGDKWGGIVLENRDKNPGQLIKKGTIQLEDLSAE